MRKFNFNQAINYQPFKLNDFLGVDFANDPSEVNIKRSPDSKNAIASENNVIEKRTGFQINHTFASGAKVNGIHWRREYIYDGLNNNTTIDILYVHVGTELWRLEKTTWQKMALATVNYPSDVEYVVLADKPSLIFETAIGMIIISDGKILMGTNSNYYVAPDYIYYACFENMTQANANNYRAYTPTTSIARSPSGGGETHEAINIMSPTRSNTFLGTASDTIYQLDATLLDARQLVDDKYTYTKDYGTVRAYRLNSSGNMVVYASEENNNDTWGAFTWSADASTNVFTYDANHGFSVNQAIIFGANTGVLPTGVVAGVVYYVLTVPATTTMTISATRGGSVLDITTSGTAGFKTMTQPDNALIVDRTLGKVNFIVAPGVSPTTGVDNVEIIFYKKQTVLCDRLSYAKVQATFGLNGSDDYIFLGNVKTQPNYDYYGRASDFYFPDLGYTRFGSDQSEIMGYSRLGEYLAIHSKSPSEDKTLYLRSVSLDANNEIIFPVRQGMSGVDALAMRSFNVLRDDPLFLSQYGIVSLNTNAITNTQSLQDRGYYINKRLLTEANLENAVSVIHDNKYMLFVNGHVYVADSRRKYSERNAVSESYQYEWYYWEGIDAKAVFSYDGTLYFGTSDGKLCTMRQKGTAHAYLDNDTPVIMYWCTPVLFFNDITVKKSLKNLWIRFAQYMRSGVKVYYRVRGEIKFVKEKVFDVFTFEDIDFTRMTFETDLDPEVVVTNRVERQFMSIQFKVLNDADENMGLIEMVAKYRTNSAYKGG